MRERPHTPRADGHRVRIERLAHGGAGVAHLDGRVLFVEGGMPGELVEVDTPRLHRRHAWTRALRVVEAAPERVPPRCPHRPRCGGCPWHELARPAQLAAKADLLVDTLRRLGRLDVEALPVEAPGSELGFRVRARLHLERARGRTRAGYRHARSQQIVDVEQCPILHPALGDPTARALALARRERWPTAVLRVSLGTEPLRAAAVLTLRADGQRAGALADALVDCGFGGVQVLAAPAELLLAARGDPGLAGVVAAGCAGGPYGHDARTFVQAQLEGNRQLIAAVLAACGAGPGQRVLELHAGAGNLSLPLAARGARVRAVEVAPPALAWLRRNLRRSPGADRVAVVAADVETAPLPAVVGADAVDVLLLDPPRTGFARLPEVLGRTHPGRVVYVSCDPATLARDVRELPALGYRVTGLRALDLMPGSWHVESVLWLDCTT